MILVTGGAGYIGSHCVLALLEQGETVLLFDNLSTGHIRTVDVLKKYGNLCFVEGDLQNKSDIKSVFEKNNINSVIHFAAFSQVAESVKNPSKYYKNNVLGTLNLLDVMVDFGVKQIVFSSTAATYGEPKYIPIDENHPQAPINPYGKSKFMIEQIMDDYDKAYGLKSIKLRYFNVIGADKQFRIGEWHEPETHLIPNILKSVFNANITFEIYGDDYSTKDGTCCRDYVDVEDLVQAHLLALKYLKTEGRSNYFNLGTKTGNTVLEVFNECEKLLKANLNKNVLPRREGDPVSLVADNSKAKKLLKWSPKKVLEDSIKSAYNWERVLVEES